MRARVFAVLLAGIVALSALAAAGGAAGPPTKLKAAGAVEPTEVIQGVKSLSGRLAKSDPSLLGRTDAELLNVMVKLDYDPTASYAGGIAGLPATSPKVTGKKLRANRGAVRAYEAHVAKLERGIVAEIDAKVEGATVRESYQTAYGGVSMQVPANKIAELLQVEGVVAVQRDSLERPLTDASPAFVGATAVWPSLGGSSRAGEGVIVGVLDTGVWPEHPSYADPGISHPGGAFGCEFGDGSDPMLGAPFVCNDKLIGAYAKTATYMAVIGALPGEYCNNLTGQCSARDADGHGTHTSSTAAGSPVASVPHYGVERGPVSGIAPGAHLIMYRVCLNGGCFQSDSVSAVNQAILDGADVLNFSISGGSSAYTDPVELAFLAAYDAGILVNASAGNSGPGAATANHAGPWTNTVGASTSDRHFVGTLTITADNGDTFELEGATVTDGISTPTPVVYAGDVAGQPDDMCRPSMEAPGVTFAPGSVAGQIVVCGRQLGARVLKSWNVMQGGGAGMILFNRIPNLGLNTDNHWVPSFHVEKTNPAADPHPLVDFLATHTGETATFTTGAPTPVRGDVMTSFSSRGPVGDFLKPDVTAPGIQILAGRTPAPHPANLVVGPPGELYQAIAGTSMSSPHAAGVSALVKAAHPDWTPGQIKSALMTSSVQDVLKEDGATASTPFDRGAGSVRANRAVSPTVTFDVDSADYFASALDPLNRIHLNLPSVNASPMPGMVTTTRTMENVSGARQVLRSSAMAPAGATISVSPKTITVEAGAEATIEVTIDATDLADGQYFGQVNLTPLRPGFNDVVLPVAFRKGPGAVSLTHACAPTEFAVGESASCIVEAANFAPVPANASLTVTGPQSGQLEIRNVSAPGVPSGNGFTWSGTLSPALAPEIASITPGGSPAGYLPLSGFGIAPIGGVGDETLVNFNVPPFKYGDETYTRMGIVANGYLVVGGGASQDISFVPQTFPNPARPNNVLAPYWTDLNPSAGGALRVGRLTDGVRIWTIYDWENVPVFSTGAPRSFQVWIQEGATENVTFTYGPAMGPGDPAGLNVGAENRDGTSGVNLGAVPAAGDDYTINSTGPVAGGGVSITYDAFGRNAGTFDVLAALTADVVQGTATSKVTLTVTK